MPSKSNHIHPKIFTFNHARFDFLMPRPLWSTPIVVLGPDPPVLHCTRHSLHCKLLTRSLSFSFSQRYSRLVEREKEKPGEWVCARAHKSCEGSTSGLNIHRVPVQRAQRNIIVCKLEVTRARGKRVSERRERDVTENAAGDGNDRSRKLRRALLNWESSIFTFGARM